MNFERKCEYVVIIITEVWQINVIVVVVVVVVVVVISQFTHSLTRSAQSAFRRREGSDGYLLLWDCAAGRTLLS